MLDTDDMKYREHYRQQYKKYKQKYLDSRDGGMATQRFYNRAAPNLVGKMRGVQKPGKFKELPKLINAMSKQHWKNYKSNIALLAALDLKEVDAIKKLLPKDYENFLEKKKTTTKKEKLSKIENKALFGFLNT